MHRTLTFASGIIALTALLAFENGLFSSSNAPAAPENQSEFLTIKPVESIFAEHRKTEPSYPLPGFIASQMPVGDYQQIKHVLIEQASQAVRMDDRQSLGKGLALLGAAALYENDLASSRVYLNEALEVYEEDDDVMGIGSVELLRSRVETVARENARDAASAYDVMQIAAWMIQKDRFTESEGPIQSAIAENLRLDRFGSAAAGYEMLERGYRSIGNTLAANAAAANALKLHAASGRVSEAFNLLDRLSTFALPFEDQQKLEHEIGLLEKNYLRSLTDLGRAKDFEQLYRRMIAAGDPVQAWTFRQKANQALSLASKRAMHRRQTGIVALLYNSNDNRRDATESLERARRMFTQAARQDLLDYVSIAERNIW